MAAAANSEKKTESKFSKEELLSAVRFANRRDLLQAVLEEDKKYSISEVDKKIKDFYERKVE